MSDYVIWPYDCVDTMLHILDEKSVHCVVTSPPYFNLRDYGTARYVGGDPNHEHDKAPARGGRGGSGPGAKNTGGAFPSLIPAPICSCGAQRIDGQVGREETPDAYVAKMVEVSRAIWRVLRDDGTFWLNIGDSYANDGKWGGSTGGKHVDALHGGTSIGRSKISTGLKPKELMMIPARVALALQADGWYLRQDIIWSKSNTMPESVRDRFTKSHEHVFLFTKQPRYFFDQEAVKEPAIYAPGKTTEVERPKGYYKGKWSEPNGGGRNDSSFKAIRTLRNRRDVWVIPTKAFGGAHFAAFPPALAEPCILAGSPPSCCAACGAPRVPKIERKAMVIDRSARTHELGRSPASGHMISPAESRVVGYFPSCECDAPDAPATVLDPFGGTGTTAMVALKHGRRAVLCEINPDYIEVAHKRIVGGK